MSKPKAAVRRGLSMTTILVLMIVSLVGAILAGCLLVLFPRYEDSIVQNARTSSSQAVAQVTKTVSSYNEDMAEVMTLLTDALDDDTVDRSEFLAAFLQMRPDVVAVSTYDGNGALVDCWSLGHTPRRNILQNLSFDRSLAVDGVDAYVSTPHVETIFDSYYPWVVTMAAHLSDGSNTRWVALDLSFASISSYISNVGIGQHGYCYLVDENGDIVYHPQQQLIYSGLKSEDTGAIAGLADGSYVMDNVIYSIESVENSHWRVVGISYMDELVTSNVTNMLRIMLLAAGGVLAVTLVSSLVVSSLLSRPLKGLAFAMEDFERDADHFFYRPVRGSREVSDLSDSFGHMVLQIQQLMATVRKEEIDLRKTELKALQAQINPHFLYNTLDSIAWMCEQKRSEDAVQMVHALATLFRISISRGQELIPIEKELEHARSYLQIQKYRYKNQFTYRFTVDENCLEYLCNKITLQPIIENAIYHGLDIGVEEGEIHVTVRQEGEDIVFLVEDNGVGMSEEQVAGMLSREPSDRTGIGIKNVNDRLRIYFGEKYGLSIRSELDVGTTVEIRMPKIREGEYEAK